jgi:hypothetical protein
MYPKSRFCSILQQPSLDVVGMLDMCVRLEATCTLQYKQTISQILGTSSLQSSQTLD